MITRYKLTWYLSAESRLAAVTVRSNNAEKLSKNIASTHFPINYKQQPWLHCSSTCWKKPREETEFGVARSGVGKNRKKSAMKLVHCLWICISWQRRASICLPGHSRSRMKSRLLWLSASQTKIPRKQIASCSAFSFVECNCCFYSYYYYYNY